NVSSVFYDSDDPVNQGINYIEESEDHSTKSTGKLTVFDENFSEAYNGKVSAFKGRGNMTWDAAKRGYQVKLDKKADLLDPADGKQKAKKWLLISSPFDGTMLLNEFIYAMAHEMGMSETTEGKPVDFYYDGQYRGTYYLCEKVEIGTGRLEIDDLEKDIEDANPDVDLEELPLVTGKNKYGEKIQYVEGINDPEDISGGYLLELDNLFYEAEASYFLTNNSRPVYVSKQPEFLSKNAVSYISEFMHDYYRSITDGGVNKATGKRFTEYLDLNSAVRYYTIQQFTKNNDAFNTSTFFYKPKGEDKIYAGPLWDCDATMGHRRKTEDPTGILDQGRMDSSWMKIAEFREAFYDYFRDEFRGVIERMILDREGENTWYRHAENLNETTAMNFTVWGPESNDSFFNWPQRWQNLTDQYNWLLTRIEWFDRKLKEIDITRLYGDNRYRTSLKAADTLKQLRGIEKFEKIILADGNKFPDALCSGFLAQNLEAPIILINDANSKMVTDYINDNLTEEGSIIVLGGENAISSSILSRLNNDYSRVYGNNRYETNLEILNYLDAEFDTLLVCSGNNYPDSLSASALNVPIMLVNNSLQNNQLEFLAENEFSRIYIIGGTSAVNSRIESELEKYAEVKRISGANRYQTSRMVAEEFFEDPDTALISYALNFPDGLCGGPLAGVLNAPVLLTADGNTYEVRQYFSRHPYPDKLYILGGSALISDSSVTGLFDTFTRQQVKSDKY
ncbi:MAG: cell wall-binding repeat-containing protein, partial [Erysipelotrichaceae bacterium]|nr:cell wall-binding repeat-containing protein [Erysipelotrichaceae bacterium]